MTRPRPRRDNQRGNSLLLALIVMSSLATLGSLTVVSVQSSLKASTNDRSGNIAMYAAESGGALAIEFMKGMIAPGGTIYIKAGNATPLYAPTFASNGAQPGSPNNPFTADQNAWFSVVVLNNRNDAGFDAGTDQDEQIIIRSTGNGPQGSVAIIEWEIRKHDSKIVLIGWHIVL